VSTVLTPTEFEKDGRRFAQEWRSASVAVFSDGADYYAFALRVVAGEERRAELIASSRWLHHCVEAALEWEAQ
jgi:hypothetical protein